jgi:hypothetical protein
VRPAAFWADPSESSVDETEGRPFADFLGMIRRRRAAAGARLSPTQAPPADTASATRGGTPRNRKSSVAAGTTETPCDVGEQTGRRERYDQRNNRLQKRMRLLDELRGITRLPSLKRCGAVPLAGAVSVTQNGDGSGGFSGLFRCGSVWSCPECMPVVRADRAANLETWAAAWMGGGHGLAMATLTSRHGEHARLDPQLQRTAGAWRRMLQSRWWRRFRDDYGIVGVARALEITHSWANSWHSHIHAVLWTEEEVSEETAAAMQAKLYERWRAECEHAKLGRPTKKNGVRVDAARRGREGAADLAKYVVKLQDGQDGKALGNELLRGDLKDGRRDGRTALEILRRAIAGDEAERELWLEYEAATKGHRMLTWSGQIRDRLDQLVDVEERDPAAVVTDDDTRDTKVVLVQVTPGPWQHKVAAVPGRRGQVRTAVQVAAADAGTTGAGIEDAARAAVAELLESWGLERGVDWYGPDDERFNVDTGEINRPVGAIEPPTAAPKRPGGRPWASVADLEASQRTLGIRPRDYVRPEQARRRAAGLPIARELR